MILAALALHIVSLVPSKTSVHTDETFSFVVHARNDGAEAAKDVTLMTGGNALTLLRQIEAPQGWTCDGPTPRFGYAFTCTSSSFAANAEAVFKVTLAAPQPTAMTFRVGAAIDASRVEENIALMVSERHAELSMTARNLAFDICNEGPDDARELTAIVSGTTRASGDGWACKPIEKSVVCTRGLLRAGTTSTITASGEGKIAARVRAENTWDSQGKNNGAKAP